MANELMIPGEMPADLAEEVRRVAEYRSFGYHPLAAVWADKQRARQVLTRQNPEAAFEFITKLLTMVRPREGADTDDMIPIMVAVCGDFPADIWTDKNLIEVLSKQKFSPMPAELHDLMEPFALRSGRLVRLLDILSVKPAREAEPYEIPPAPPPRPARLAVAYNDPPDPGGAKTPPVAKSGARLHDPVRTVEEQIRIINGGAS